MVICINVSFDRLTYVVRHALSFRWFVYVYVIIMHHSRGFSVLIMIFISIIRLYRPTYRTFIQMHFMKQI